MKQKLTKNDSISTVVKDFDVLVAAFEALLSRNGVRVDYYAMWARFRTLSYGDTIEQQWRTWAGNYDPSEWLFRAFMYDITNIPSCVWSDIESQWYGWISDSLNK